MNVPENLLYTKEHEWVRLDGTAATVGVTDFAQGELGDVVFVELPAAGTQTAAGKSLGTIEAVKTVADIYAPVTGKVLEVNGALGEKPELVNASPYDKGWMVRIEVKDPAETRGLLTPKQYRELVEGGAHA